MDDIKRKLALIDKQLAGGFFNSYQRIISTSPLVFAAAGLILGILIQNTFFESQVTLVRSSFSEGGSNASQFFWLILLVLCATGAFISFVTQRFSFNNQLSIINNQFIMSYLAFVGFACLGAIRLNSFYQPRPDDIRNFIGNERKLATVRGLIITNPYINRNKNWKFARFKFTDPDTSFYLKLGELKTIDGWSKVSGTIRVQVAEPILDLKAGDYIQAYCWLDRFKPSSNPGEFDIAKYLARKNVFIAASIKSRDSVKLLKDNPIGLFTKIKSRFKNTATQALLDGPFPEDQSESLLQALLLGYRRDIDSATYEAFRRTGLLHFISLSGLHLGILVGTIWWLCKTMGLAKRSRAIVCIIAVGIFLLIVPPRAPTLRAAIIAWVFCLSFFFRRKSNSINTLSLAAIILLLIRPTDLFEAGWQLSFASVIGIILFTGRIENYLYEKVTDNFWIEKILKTKLFFRVPPALSSHLLKLFFIGLAAWLGGAGILLYHFYTINPLASIWTVIVFPFVAAILSLGYLKMILSFLLPTIAWLLGILATGLADLLIWIVKLIAHLDILHILIGHVPITMIILYYCIIAFAFFVHFQRPLTKKIILTTMFFAIFIFFSATKLQRTHRDNLVLICLDVGHGQAILAQFPGGANILFDAGSLHKSDIGRRIVAPFLDYSGLSKIDAIIISHDDVDHINGIPEIIEHCKVGGIYANNAFFSKTDTWGAAKFLNDCLLEQDYEIKTLGKNLSLQSNANIKILWPTQRFCQNEDLDDNDKSTVVLIEFAGRKILLCSDIMKFAQRELLQLYPDLKADVVVAPHHGSLKTADPNFLENLDADILLCSCEERQYKKANPSGSDKLTANDAKSFYTPKDGAIIIRISKEGTITCKCINDTK